MYMKKKLALSMSLVLTVLLLAGCAKPAPVPSDTLTGALTDVLAAVLTGAQTLLDEADQITMSFEDEVTAENSAGMLGLTAEDFGKYVSEAYASNAAFITFAHEIALVRCVDAGAAAKVKKLVADGFDPNKWICVWPQRSVVIDSGSYVLLVASRNVSADAILQSFKTLAEGNVGEADVFFTAPEGGGASDGGIALG
jgi:hypothetical protein